MNRTESREAAIINCSLCGHSFNALRAEWCGCLTENRSLVCPRCGKCFCSSTPEWKRAFWDRAPLALKRKRLEANRTSFEPPKFLLRDEIRRPLVLVAEDNRLIHLLATKMISALGYGVIGAMNGQEAIEAARIYEPDIILTDALMPVMDGREMCRRVKSDAVLGGIPVVLMSSVYKEPTHSVEARGTYKADEFLVKPVGEEALRAVLRRFVGSASRHPARSASVRAN